MQPVPLKLNFAITPPEGGTTVSYIDLSQCVSHLARKFMRQGLNWAISSIKVTMPAASSAQGNAVYISTLQNTWVTYNAWKKAFAHWLEQQNEALAEAGGSEASAKYRDFKIYAEEMHYDAGVGSNLLPVSLGPGSQVGPFASPVIVGTGPSTTRTEWDISQFVLQNYNGVAGDTREVQPYMLGQSDYPNNKYSLVQEYGNSRPRIQLTNPVVDADFDESLYARMNNEGDDSSEILDNATVNNNRAPYRDDHMVGGETFPEMENVCFALNSSTIQQRTFTFPGFNAPCGLLRIDQVFSDSGGLVNDLIIEITLAPGDNRGYFAIPMQEC